MRYILILFPFIFAFMWQEKTTHKIIHADYNLGKKVNNEQLRILKGAVHVVRDTINMFCDSSYYFEKAKRLELFGSVKIINGKRTLQADKMIYFIDREVLECTGNVRGRGENDALNTQFAIYNLKEKELYANEDVYISDTENRVIIEGEKALLRENAGYFRVTHNAKFFQWDSAGADTFKITAKSLEYFSDSLDYAFARDSVVLKQEKLVAHCDSLWYFKKDEKARLFGTPQVWYDNSEMTGKKIFVDFDSTEIKTINIFTKAHVKTVNDSAKNEFNALKGKHIEFFIQARKPQLIIARDNATSQYHFDENDEKGANLSSSDSIFVFFKAGALDSIEIIGGAQGTYYPESYKGERKFGK